MLVLVSRCDDWIRGRREKRRRGHIIVQASQKEFIEMDGCYAYM